MAREPRRGPLPWPLSTVAGPLGTPVYRAVIGARNRRFDAGRGVVRFDRVVISVGNLSVGGTGKTPMVAQIVRWLLEAGHRPVIAMRGYAAKPSARGAGESDEASVYRRLFPQVPIVAQANRTLGLIQQFAREFEEHGEVDEADVHGAAQRDGGGGRPAGHSDCIVLDDGFQHRQIARDLDIVLIDATRDPFADRLLPGGWLREPVESLQRAGAVVITHAESAAPADVTALERAIERVRGRVPEAIARHDWAGVSVSEAGAEHAHSVEWLTGKRALAVCAIGNPAPFLQQVRRATGVQSGGEIALGDHDPYLPATVRRIIEEARSLGAQVIVTTEKDWSKLRHVPAESWPCPIARVRLDMGFGAPHGGARGGEELRRLVVAAVAAGAPE
jgi:tetraacyldisaccharide 4'-kinase